MIARSRVSQVLCCPITCTRFGHCQQATSITRHDGRRSKPALPGNGSRMAGMKLIYRKHRKIKARVASGNRVLWSTPFATKTTSAITLITSIGTRSSTATSSGRLIGRGHRCIVLCVKESCQAIGVVCRVRITAKALIRGCWNSGCERRLGFSPAIACFEALFCRAKAQPTDLSVRKCLLLVCGHQGLSVPPVVAAPHTTTCLAQ